ncbi:MAG: patatin-like phospholipase family protein [Flavobacteriales bacterium]|nr:patatin-like phospholipase family protein [Flavobacteriales bacterium]
MFLHFKRNHFLLLFWLVLFGIITHSLGSKFGLAYLFLYPEYLGEVGFMSHFIMGFSCAGFIMAFNMYSYVMHGYKFSFIATVSKPFYKFSINNFIIPAAFILLYVYQAVHFQYNKELEPVGNIIRNMSGFFTGLFVFFFFSMYYFFKTNKDFYKLSGKTEEAMEEEIKSKGIQTTLHKKIKWYELFNTEHGWNVETYMASPFRIKIARESKHYDTELLKRVLAQNHINASIFEIVMVISFLLFGSMGENSYFLIPAGASVLLVFTMLIMIISAVYSWLRGWTFTFMIGLLILLNYLSLHTELFSYKNFAYGLDYSGKQATYNLSTIHEMQSDKKMHKKDMNYGLESLNQWRAKNNKLLTGDKAKPKFVVICTSGGGIRSALWTLNVLQNVDSTLNGTLMDRTHLITGSSGGMIGAAYYRELFLREKTEADIHRNDKKYIDKISQDILNPVAFTIATNDIFIRYRHFSDGPYSYTIDRGYMFEKQLNINLDSAFDKRLYDYIVPERNSEIPTMMFCPTIINDGRRLIISSQPVSYLTNCQPEIDFDNIPGQEYIEFTKMFEHQNAWNLRYSSAIRMNASFPYVMPMVTLPSEPTIEVMDAGYRDNYGIRLALRYIYVFRNWISSNTDGVVFIQVRDRQKEVDEPLKKNSVMKLLVKPLGNLYDNIFNTQDFDNDQLLQYASSWLDCPLDVVNFHMIQNEKQRTSLSWHLTRLEKQQVISSLKNIPENQESMEKLKKLLE